MGINLEFTGYSKLLREGSLYNDKKKLVDLENKFKALEKKLQANISDKNTLDNIVREFLTVAKEFIPDHEHFMPDDFDQFLFQANRNKTENLLNADNLQGIQQFLRYDIGTMLAVTQSRIAILNKLEPEEEQKKKAQTAQQNVSGQTAAASQTTASAATQTSTQTTSTKEITAITAEQLSKKFFDEAFSSIYKNMTFNTEAEKKNVLRMFMTATENLNRIVPRIPKDSKEAKAILDNIDKPEVLLDEIRQEVVSPLTAKQQDSIRKLDLDDLDRKKMAEDAVNIANNFKLAMAPIIRMLKEKAIIPLGQAQTEQKEQKEQKDQNESKEQKRDAGFEKIKVPPKDTLVAFQLQAQTKAQTQAGAAVRDQKPTAEAQSKPSDTKPDREESPRFR